MNKKDFIGKVAKCSKNCVGIISGVTKNNSDDGFLWTGFTIDGLPWQSVCPTIIAESVREYIESNLDEFLTELNVDKQ